MRLAARDKFTLCPRICVYDFWSFATASRERDSSCNVWHKSIRIYKGESMHPIKDFVCVCPSASTVTSLVPGAQDAHWECLGRPETQHAEPSVWLCLHLQETTVCDCKWCLDKPHFCWAGRFLGSESQYCVVWKRLFGDQQQISRFSPSPHSVTSRRDNSLGFRRDGFMGLCPSPFHVLLCDPEAQG